MVPLCRSILWCRCAVVSYGAINEPQWRPPGAPTTWVVFDMTRRTTRFQRCDKLLVPRALAISPPTLRVNPISGDKRVLIEFGRLLFPTTTPLPIPPTVRREPKRETE